MHRKNTVFIVTGLQLLVICVAVLTSTYVSSAEKSLTLAVHPYLPAVEIKKRFQPLATHLGKALGRSIEIRIGGNYEEHIEAIGEDQVDIAFFGPAGYVVMRSKYGQKPLLARFEVNGQPFLYGVIAIRKDSSLSTLAQLRNKRFAFGDKRSTMSHIVPRHMLMAAGLVGGLPAKYRFLGSHKNVAIGILAGDYDAGAMKKEIFDEFQPRGLRALAITPGVPDHLFVASTMLPPADVERLREALLSLRKTATGRTILTGLHKNLTALVSAKDAEYNQLRVIFQAVENASNTGAK